MKLIADKDNLNRIINRLSREISERNAGGKDVAIIGIRRRGVQVALRISKAIERTEGVRPDVGILDATLFRDDILNLKDCEPLGCVIDFDINGRNIILCDDVLFTGRTVRAAISALMSMGRPEKIQLLVIADRGHREFPFRADYIGKNIPTSREEQVCVKFSETDGEDGIYLLKGKGIGE